MAENKTKPTTISVPSFLDACIDEERRTDAKALTKLMQKVTGNEPAMWGTSIVGFGSYHYTYESGREGDMLIVGFSPRKAANVLYGTIGFDGAEELLAKLGKHTTGKDAGCTHLVVRGKTLEATMSDYLVQRIVCSPRIKLHLHSEIDAILGDERLHAVQVRDRSLEARSVFKVTNIFVMIGADPNTSWLKKHVDLDHNGFVETGRAEWEMQSRFATSKPGIFAIGDVRAGSVNALLLP
jgi:Pyridine nucleotide-disulphide oxidoreductase